MSSVTPSRNVTVLPDNVCIRVSSNCCQIHVYPASHLYHFYLSIKLFSISWTGCLFKLLLSKEHGVPSHDVNFLFPVVDQKCFAPRWQ